MIAGKYNITMYLNRDYVQIFEFDFDITNYTFIAALNHNGTDIYFILNTIDSYRIELKLPKTIVNIIGIGVFQYDLAGINNGYTYQFVEGIVNVKPTITD